MLGFAAPAALIALSALAVPIVLHLWSRLTGRPVRVGTVAWFAAAPPPVARRPQIEDPWLLALRCGILAALALALAQPYWRSGVAGGGATWALVTPEAAADSLTKPLLDSLRAAGTDIHVLGDGPIWSLLREADYEAPAGTKFVVVAPNRGADGERPILRSETQWIVPPLRPHPLSPSPESGEGERSGRSRSVMVYSDATRREDAKYVTAALRAAAQATGVPAVVTQRDVASVGSEADWIVWLAARAVPSEILEQTRRGATLLTDALADSAVEQWTRLLLTAATRPAPALRRRTMAAADEAPLWLDDAGHAVLTVRRLGLGRHLAFHGRFHPSWGDLVLDPAFPEAMTALWADGLEPSADAPAIAVSQLLPARASATRSAGPARRDLYHLFWLIAVLLFMLERALARRSRAVQA
jgi:hypothetical protein